MKTCLTISEIQYHIKPFHRDDIKVALVPTMGNLHDGHLSLIKMAKKQAEKVIVSLFVNPLQFGPTEDFEKYPRTVEADLEKLQEARVDAVFMPKRQELYPKPEDELIKMDLPQLTRKLCGITRPHFFQGVMVVVAKLFNIIQPNVAIFGEKDYQQLIIVKQMVKDLNFPVHIVSSPTVRESNGLAMSSRNSYLTDEERSKAPLLYQTLCHIKNQILVGDTNYRHLESMARKKLNTEGFNTDYIAIRTKTDLTEPESDQESLIILAAAYLNQTRLIDNILLTRPI